MTISRIDDVEKSNVVPIRSRVPEKEPLAFAPGVAPFDRSNPAHIKAWNTIFALGWSERNTIEREAE